MASGSRSGHCSQGSKICAPRVPGAGGKANRGGVGEPEPVITVFAVSRVAACWRASFLRASFRPANSWLIMSPGGRVPWPVPASADAGSRLCEWGA